MPKFMCLIHFDETSFVGITPEESTALTDVTIEEDRQLRREGRLLAAQPLQGPETAVSIKVRNGRPMRSDGPFMESKEWLGGIMLILAEDMEEAIRIASQSEISKRSRVEIRPTLEQAHSVTEEERPQLWNGSADEPTSGRVTDV